MPLLANIWRHPIKAHGAEPLQKVALLAGQTLPWDRHWAVGHDASQADGTQWAQCSNFSRGAKAPQLMAITATLNEDSGALTLSHPELSDLTFDPDTQADLFLEWVSPLMPKNRATSNRIVQAKTHGMTDMPYASISLNSVTSLADFEAKLGQSLDQRRFRGNLWIDDVKPWAEFDWIGKHVRIGGCILKIAEPIGRCMATTANPDTGLRDADTLDVLNSAYGHQDFGVCGTVIEAGEIKIGDRVDIL